MLKIGWSSSAGLIALGAITWLAAAGVPVWAQTEQGNLPFRQGAEYRGRRRIQGEHRIGNQQVEHLEHARLSAVRLRREDRETRRRMEMLNHVGMRGPERYGRERVLVREYTESADDCSNLVE